MTAISAELPAADAPIVEVDPFSDAALHDPYPGFVEIRDAGPVVRLARYGIYAVGRFAEAQTVLTDFKRFTTTGGVGMSDIRKPGAWRTASPITEIDPPIHTGVRAALARILSPAVVRRWKEAFAAQAEIVADQVLALGTFDGVSDLAEAFVLSVFPRVLGIDVPPDNFVAVGEMNFNQLGPNNDRVARSVAQVAPILDWYQGAFQRSAALKGGFAEQIFAAEDAGDLLPGTAPAHVRSFLRAGVDTTIAGLGHTLRHLADRPDLWTALRNDPVLVRKAFEEALRYESPSQAMFRTTVGEQELGGVRLDADTKVCVLFGAANRDPRRWPEPDRFDPYRNATGHLAFGAGAHVCIGNMIARTEAECILGALARRARTLSPAGPARMRLVNTLRTLDTLPLRVTPA